MKRLAGVSYVKASESKQLNVNYDKLAPICYQGSYNMPTVDVKPYQIFESVMNNPICFAFFESPDEQTMKQYILNPSQRLTILPTIYIAPSIKHLGQLCMHNYFIIILMNFDRILGLVSCNAKAVDVVKSDV